MNSGELSSEPVLINPALLDNRMLRGGLTSFFFQYLLMSTTAGRARSRRARLAAGQCHGVAASDEQSAEVGGLQNTVTFVGSATGTALAGAVLVSGLTTSFLTGIQENSAIEESVSTQAAVDLGGGVPFISDAQLDSALTDAGVDEETASAVITENEEARIDALRVALATLATLALLAMFLTHGVPTRQPKATATGESSDQ